VEIKTNMGASGLVYPNRYYKCAGEDKDLFGVFLIKYADGVGVRISKDLAIKEKFTKDEVKIAIIDNSVIAFLVKSVGKDDYFGDERKAKELLTKSKCKKLFSPLYAIERLDRIKRMFHTKCIDMTTIVYRQFSSEEITIGDERTNLLKECITVNKFAEEQAKIDELTKAKRDVIMNGVKMLFNAIPLAGAIGDLASLAEATVKAINLVNAIKDMASDVVDLWKDVSDISDDSKIKLDLTSEEMVRSNAMDEIITGFKKNYIDGLVLKTLSLATNDADRKKVCPSPILTTVNVIKATGKFKKLVKPKTLTPYSIIMLL
jgi:hypothetical protein